MVQKFLFLVASGVLCLSVGVYPGDAVAGCRINLFVKNTGKQPLSVIIQAYNETGVKTRGGVWRSLSRAGWFRGLDRWPLLKANEKQGDRFLAAFGCKAKRRYRIYYKCRAGAHKARHFTAYYPSGTTWTRKTTLTINLGLCK